MNLLLVDDEPIALRKLERRVNEVLPDAQIASFTSAKQAVDFAKITRPDIAFLDIQMRVMDGISVAKELREIYPRTNIIFCTGFSEYALNAHEVFCSGYLMKPVTTEQLKNVLENLRYPLQEAQDKDARVVIQCEGMFEVFYKGEAVRFSYNKTKELLALLVDSNGGNCSTAWINAALFGDEDHSSYIRKLRKDLLDTFRDIGAPDVIISEGGNVRINREEVVCDYFDFLDGKREKPLEEYMKQYSFI